MDLVSCAARYRLGALSSDDIKRIAEAVLETDHSTPTWVEIATSSTPIMSTVGPLFERGLREAGVSLPSTADAIWQATRYHIGRIASRSVPPREGMQLLMDEVYYGADLYELSDKYVGDSHGLSEIIGNYYSYDDLDERPDEVSCDGLHGEEGKAALGEHIVRNAKTWLERYGV